MKRNDLLTVTSLLSVLLFSIHSFGAVLSR